MAKRSIPIDKTTNIGVKNFNINLHYIKSNGLVTFIPWHRSASEIDSWQETAKTPPSNKP
jgi:hypothetical protein